VLKSDEQGFHREEDRGPGTCLAAIAQRAYAGGQGAATDGGAGGGGAGPGEGPAVPVRRVPRGSAGAGAKAEENVVDAEFEEVRDKGRRAS